MGVESKPISWNRLLVDICIQRDFLDTGAILQVANRSSLLPNLEKIFTWVQEQFLPVFSSVESHRPTEPLKGFPLHCIDGTPGQQKLPLSLLSPRIIVETDNCLSLPPGLRQNYRQLIFRKRAREVLSNPKADRFLTQLEADEFIIFGVGLERAIRCLALAMIARHKNVTVISDACGYWSSGDADLALRQLEAKGIRLVTTSELTAPPARKRQPVKRRSARQRPLSAVVASTPARHVGSKINEA